MKIESLSQMENLYIEQFSQKDENKQMIYYTDDNLPNMYSHNFTLIKENQNMLSLLKSELNKCKKEHKSFLRIETYFKISEEILGELPIKSEKTINDFMFINSNKYHDLKGNTQCVIKEANTKEILEAGIQSDILSNKDNMGEFAKLRIERKAQIYQSPNSIIHFYVCFYHNMAIGTCEMMIDDNHKIAKIEDFDILKNYQRKGFGTSVLKYLLEIAFKNKCENVYLITDSEDTAKDMYKKCGFTKIGEKYELFFQVEEKNT